MTEICSGIPSTCPHCLRARAEQAEARRDEAIAEGLEQARLLGISGSKEARLIAERDALAAALAKLLDVLGEETPDHSEWESVALARTICRAALADPLAALREHDLRIAERAARNAYQRGFKEGRDYEGMDTLDAMASLYLFEQMESDAVSDARRVVDGE